MVVSMRDTNTDHPSTSRPSHKKSRPIMHRTPLVTCGLVGVAIIVGLVFYAQGGFLHTDTSNTVLSSATDEKPATPTTTAPEETTTLTPNFETVTPVPTPRETPSSTDTATNSMKTSCDKATKADAEKRRAQALSTEDSLHQRKLRSINDIARWFSKLHIGNAKERIQTENKRHDQALQAIEMSYRQTLTEAGCTD